MRLVIYMIFLCTLFPDLSTGYAQLVDIDKDAGNGSGIAGGRTFATKPIGGGEPLSLHTAIQTGLDNNPELKSSFEKVNAAQGRFWSGIAPESPEVSFANDYIPKGHALNRYGERTIGVSQTIEFPTKYLLRGSHCSIEKRVAENELAMARLRVISEIKKTYFTVCALQKQVAIALENLAIAEDFVRKADVRHAVDEGTNLEKLTAKVSCAEALNSVAVTKSHLGNALSVLNCAMGYGKGESKAYTIVDSLTFVPFDFTLDKLMELADSANPLLKVNKLQVASCTVAKSLAWSGILPVFTVGVFNQQVSGDATGYYGASFGIGIPLWFMMNERGKILEASSNEAAATADLRAVCNTVFAKTEAAFTEFKQEEQQIQMYLQEILPQAGAMYRTAEKSYEAGEITYMEFLQAQQTLIQSRGRYVEALLSYNCAIVAIEETIGKTLP